MHQTHLAQISYLAWMKGGSFLMSSRDSLLPSACRLPRVRAGLPTCFPLKFTKWVLHLNANDATTTLLVCICNAASTCVCVREVRTAMLACFPVSESGCHDSSAPTHVLGAKNLDPYCLPYLYTWMPAIRVCGSRHIRWNPMIMILAPQKNMYMYIDIHICNAYIYSVYIESQEAELLCPNACIGKQ